MCQSAGRVLAHRMKADTPSRITGANGMGLRRGRRDGPDGFAVPARQKVGATRETCHGAGATRNRTA
jgi:hypothetical protein